MTSTYSTNKAIEEPANGDYVNTWSTPVNSNFNIIDKAFGGHLIINATGASGTTALTTTQYQNLYILFSGTLSANVNYQVPSGVGGQWVVYNGTSGAFTLTLSSGGGGSSVTITQGTRTLIVSDGTNVTLSVNTVTSPGGADTSIQFNQSGVFGGSSNLAWNYGTNTLGVTGAANISGNVGIGTTTPISRLTVSANNNATDGLYVTNTSTGASAQAWLNVVAQGWTGIQLIQNQASGTALFYTADNIPMIFVNNSTERMRITAAGNVGIGTSSPSSLLHIVGATDPVLTVTAASSGSAWLSLNGISSAVVHNPNNVPTVFTTNGTERMRVTAAGNVGIGTSSPSYLLQVAGIGYFNTALGINQDPTSWYSFSPLLVAAKTQNAETIIGIGNGTVGTAASTTLKMIGGTANSYIDMRLSDNNGSPYFADSYGAGVNFAAWFFGGTERMRITAAGNVGIGNSAPSYLLDVNGTGRFSGSLLVNGTINAYYTGKSGLLINEDSSGNVFINQQDNGPLILNTNNTERMRISAAGNVGIGTNAPAYLLDVNGTGRFTGALTLSTALSAANGGTGLTSSGANNNVLASNGTSWITASIQSLVSSCIAAVATAAGFSYSFGSNGYIVFPSWLSGIIFQWGNNSIGQNATITQSLPISFPTSFIMPFISQSSSAGTNNCLYAFTTGSLSSFSVTYSATSGGATYNYLAIGY